MDRNAIITNSIINMILHWDGYSCSWKKITINSNKEESP